ncbi:hypothetical protein ACR6A7_15730 [Pantoea sp. RRHST58]|uniref:hypothetical protein n=1 Tax=Pantoea sp. RRHST58 TaxID=3425183 RepID=UPI003DA04559
MSSIVQGYNALERHGTTNIGHQALCDTVQRVADPADGVCDITNHFGLRKGTVWTEKN